MPFSQVELSYLKNKNLGGLNNKNGGKYENFYALFQICYYLSNRVIHNNVSFSSQCFEFVDDFLIKNEGKVCFHQLKNVVSISWGNLEKLRTISNDFFLQKKKSASENLSFSLKLVVSKSHQLDHLTSTKPIELKDVASVEYFEYFEDLRTFITSNKQFSECLINILNMQNPEIDKLEALASSIFGIWSASNNSDITLDYIKDKLKYIPVAFVRSKVLSTLPQEITDIFDSIEGFKFEIDKNYLKWTYKNSDSGFVRYSIDSEEFRSIMDELLLNKPLDFSNLEEIITV